MRRALFLGVLVGASVASCSQAGAATFQVGPNGDVRQFGQLPNLNPGDVVEVEGGATYEGGVVLDDQGSAADPIVIRGVLVGGERPVISGGDNTVEFSGNHYIFENIEVTGGARRCLFHHADDITVRNVVVHDCPQHGLLGADSGSGSLTLSHSEFYANGGGLYHHQIYMATDETAYPGSVFRMEFCYVHDANGGHNVKSRAERNEIYYNWIEGAYYHELELIGPDGQSEDLAREDADVVGNVLRKSGANRDFYVIRVGGDGTGQTWGRYRFAYNTILLAPDADVSAVWRIFDGVESVSMDDNVIVQQGGAQNAVRIYRTAEAVWATGSEIVAGSHNWVPASATAVPSGWSATVTGTDPGFEDAAGFDLRPHTGSPLVDAGADSPAGPSGHEVSSVLATPAFSPSRQMVAAGAESPRGEIGAPDIGAFELGSPDQQEPPGRETPPDAGQPPEGNPPGGGDGDGSGGTGSGEGGAPKVSKGCSAGGSASLPVGLLMLALLLTLLRRRRIES